MKQYHKKYIWKRGAACMLAIALAFSGITWNGMSVSNAAGAGIPNANFNTRSLSSVSDWTQDGAVENASTSKVTAHWDSLGDYSGKLIKNGAGIALISSADMTELVAGTLYKLGVSVKTEAAEEQNIQLMVRHLKSDGSFITESIATLYQNEANRTWTTLSGYFRFKGGEYEKARLVVAMTDKQDGVFSKNATINATMYVDDASIQTVSEPSVDTVDVSYEGDLSSMQVEYDTSGYATNEPVVERATTYYNVEQSSLHVKKDSYNSQTYLRNLGRFALQNEQPMDGSVYTWGAYVKSVDSNSFLRVDLDIYNKNGEYLSTLIGNSIMLSRSENVSDWRKMSTSAELPTGAYYASYKIAVTEGKAEFYLDNLFGMVTENYYYKLSDWSYFTGVDEAGNINGWTTDAQVSVSDNTASWSTGKMTRRVETLIPGAAYQLTADYTATADGQCSIIFYDVNQKELGRLDKDCDGATERAQLTAEFVVPEKAMYAEISFGGTGSYTLTKWQIEETLGRAVDSEWTANWVWYPEKLNTENASRYFRSHFQVADKTQISAVYLQIACDDAMEIHINGNSKMLSDQYVDATEQGSNSPYQVAGKRQVLVFDITDQVQTGDNLLAVKVWNDTSYGGTVYELLVCNTDGSRQILASGVSLPVSASKSDTNWYATGAEDATWVAARNAGVPAYSVLGDVTWWAGPVDVTSDKADRLMFNTGKAQDGYLNMDDTKKITAGDEVTFSGAVASVSPEEKEAFHDSTITGWLYNHTDGTMLATVPVHVELPDVDHASFTYTVPDYLPAGTYDLRLDKSKVVWGWNTNNQFGLLDVTAATKDKKTVSVSKKENGTAGLYIEGEEISPIMYLRPHMEGLYKYHSMSNFAESDVAIYSTYNGFLDGMDYTYQKDSTDPASKCIWTGWENDAPVIDTELFDYEIYRTLNLNPKANVMVQIGVDAPKWWMEQHPNELVKNQDGTVITTGSFQQKSVSMSSALYQQQVAEVLKSLVSHMENASYAHRVVGIRLVAGRTFEWMQNGVKNGQLIDYSQAALNGFRSYLTKLYGTDAKLQSAWNDGSVTLGTAEIPSKDERNATDWVALLNPSTGQKVIDYNNYLGEASANYLLSCADAIKANMTAQWIVGAYNGYLWNFDSSEAIGSAHTSVSKVLASESIDFVASPANYGERISGYATGNMALSDSIAAAGKLYMIEQDNRTYLSGQSGDSLGATYTVSDSVDQITRDMSMDFVRGQGLWFYDMEGGWFDDNSIEARIKALKAEWDKHLDNGSNNEVAVYVAEDNYNYLTADISSGNTERTTYLMSSLYEDQRRELSAMGASYDTYMVEDVLESTDNAKWSKYKFHIVLSPFELTTDEATKLKNNLGQTGAVILWVYLPGASTGGDYSGENITNLVGMDVTLTKEKKALQAKTTGDVAGVTYGNKNAKTGPWAYITDAEATVLANYTSGEKAAAFVDKGTYVSVYSAVPDVPAEMLRYLCEKAGVHLYSADKSDVIETNNSYIAIHSVNGGEKTINLSQMQSEKYVYDVLQGKYLSVKNQKVTFQMESGQTRLLRVESEPTDMELAGTMEYQDVTENPTAYQDNLFYNGDFDGDAGSANVEGWYAKTGAIKTQVVSDDVEETVITKYSNDFTGENPIYGWNKEGTTTNVAEKEGNKVLSFTKGTNKYIIYYGTPFEAEKSYIVSCRVYCDKDTDFRLYNNSTGTEAFERKTAKGGEWTEYSISMTATSAVQQPSTFFGIMDDNSQVYIDDVSIEEVTRVVHTLPKYQILYSNDFTGENPIHGWNKDGTTTNVAEKEGNKVLSFTKGTNKYITYYGTPFEAGKSYIVSCRVYCDKDTDFRLYNNSTGTEVFERKTAKGGEWTEYSISMTATSAVQQPSTFFGIMDDNSQVYIDDVSVKRYEGEVNRKIYSEGVGNCNQEESDNVLMISQATEFWKNGVTVQEGKTYTYSMDVKVTDAGEGFTFRPYVYNFVEGGWQDITDMSVTADTNGWKKVTATFTAMKPNATDGTRFGFIRNGTGKVYLDNITLVEAEKEDEVPVDNMVSNGATLESWASMIQVPCFTGKGATGSIASKTLRLATTKYKTYIVKFRADVTGTNQIQVTLGTRTVESVDLSKVSGWKEFTCEIGIKESTTDFAITTVDGQTITWDNIRVYRKYDMGDANGDGVVDSRDLVRLKWNTSEKVSPNPLATYVFVDFTNHTGAFVDENDMKAMRTWFCK